MSIIKHFFFQEIIQVRRNLDTLVGISIYFIQLDHDKYIMSKYINILLQYHIIIVGKMVEK